MLMMRRLLLWASLAVAVQSVPYLMLTSTRPKCFIVEGPRRTTLTVHYHAPDMVILPEDDSEEVKKKDEEIKEGLDKRFNERFREKLIAMRKAGRSMADVSININQRAGDTATTSRAWNLNKSINRVREELSQVEGKVEYTTGDKDGPVEICVQSLAAAPKTPSRVAIRVTQEIKSPKRKKREQVERQTEEKLSLIGYELENMDSKVELILHNADYAKEQEVDFHQQSVDMNRASVYWPIIHMTVLLVTGFTQGHHIIRFFKSRHIY